MRDLWRHRVGGMACQHLHDLWLKWSMKFKPVYRYRWVLKVKSARHTKESERFLALSALHGDVGYESDRAISRDPPDIHLRLKDFVEAHHARPR